MKFGESRADEKGISGNLTGNVGTSGSAQQAYKIGSGNHKSFEAKPTEAGEGEAATVSDVILLFGALFCR